MPRLNLKLVLCLAAAGLVAVAAMFFIHSFQMQRTAGVLLRQAQEAEEEGDLEAATGFYRQYIFYRPDDYEAAATGALLMADLAESEGMDSRNKYASGALSMLEESLRNDPTRDDIRRRLADFAAFAGRPGDAIEHIRTLLKTTPDDPELLTKLGTYLSRTGREREGAETLRRAIELGGNQIDAYMSLAVALRTRLENSAEADKVIEDMVHANSDKFKAYLNRAQWLNGTQRPGTEAESKRLLDQVNSDVAKALELAPEEADCLLYAAQMAAMQGDLAKTKELMQQGIKLFPKNERMVQLLVEVAIAENKLDEVDELVESMPDSAALKQLQFEVKIQGADKEQARAIVDALDRDKAIDQDRIDYMRARLSLVDGKWLEATRELERLRTPLPGLQTRIDMLLGHCYEVLRQTDKQLELYTKLVGVAPNSVEAHVGLGRALLAVGQPAESLKEFERLKQAMGAEKFVKLTLARNAMLGLLTDQISRLPEDQRNWSEVDELLAAAKQENPDSKDLLMLEAKILEQKGNAADARKMIEKSLAQDNKNLSAWLSLITLTFDKDGANAALKLIEEAKVALGDIYELRAVGVSCASQMPPDECKQVLAAGLVGIEGFKPEQQKQLRQLIGSNYFRLREFAEARKIWESIVKADPTDQQALLVLFDIGVNEQDDARIVESIKAIRNLLGANSPEAIYVDVRRSLALLRRKMLDDPGATLQEARRKIREAIQLRPHWSALPRVEAEIDIAENRPDEAIINLRKAVEFGANDYAVVRQLAELLTMRGRAPEAQQILALAQSQAPNKDAESVSELIDVSVALSNNNVAKAIELLEQARTQDPDDLRKIIWLGQIKAKSALYDEAEALFRQAIEKEPNAPLSWQELVKLLRDQRRETDAREVINQLLEKMPKPQSELVAAQCCELLQDLEGAEQHAKSARDEQPNDLGLTRALAMFYARNRQYEKARGELDRMLASKPASPSDKEQIAWANREVAIMIAGRGSYADMVAGLKRLNEKLPNDKATMAAILAGRPEAESRIKAVHLLEEVRGTMPLAPDSRLVLAQLYDATGNWNKCKEEMLSLVSSLKEEPRYIATFVEMLIDHDDLVNAKLWMDQLEKLAPDQQITSAVKAKLLVKQNKPEEAIALLRDLLPRPMPREMLPTLLHVAQLMESLKLNDAAEPMYREYKVLNPAGALVLAEFLGRHGSLKDALDMCEAATENVPKESVLRGALQILRQQQDNATKEDYARVESWITKTSAQNPDSILLKLIYSELLDLEQRYSDLEESYKQMLKNPDLVGQQRAIVLNNLAFLQAVQNRPGESKKWIDEAIQIFGPTSDLLDTRALVQLANKDPKQAIADLEMAMVDQPTGVKYFHLAQAQLLNKDSQKATDAMKRALETYKLTRKELAPSEQPKFDAVMEELGLKQ